MNDRDVVEVQLGRPPRSEIAVVSRCHLDLPVVIEVPPFLEDGTPFPTRYWLTCPLAVRRVGRIEALGGVKRFESEIQSDDSMRARHLRAMDRYEAGREELIPRDHDGPRPTGGVGGARRGVKCLHAHLADHLAGNDNPVGERVSIDVEPLDCALACVSDDGTGATVNPDWREPRG